MAQGAEQHVGTMCQWQSVVKGGRGSMQHSAQPGSNTGRQPLSSSPARTGCVQAHPCRAAHAPAMRPMQRAKCSPRSVFTSFTSKHSMYRSSSRSSAMASCASQKDRRQAHEGCAGGSRWTVPHDKARCRRRVRHVMGSQRTGCAAQITAAAGHAMPIRHPHRHTSKQLAHLHLEPEDECVDEVGGALQVAGVGRLGRRLHLHLWRRQQCVQFGYDTAGNGSLQCRLRCGTSGHAWCLRAALQGLCPARVHASHDASCMPCHAAQCCESM